jgi:hypothetical protein
MTADKLSAWRVGRFAVKYEFDMVAINHELHMEGHNDPEEPRRLLIVDDEECDGSIVLSHGFAVEVAKRWNEHKRIAELEYRAKLKEAHDIWRGEQEEAIKVLKSAGLSVPVPEAIEKLIAEVADLKQRLAHHRQRSGQRPYYGS